MSGEKEPGGHEYMEEDSLERHTTSSTANEKVSHDSDSTSGTGVVSNNLAEDKASRYAAIRSPSVTTTTNNNSSTIPTPGRSLARTRSNRSSRSGRSLAHTRSQNGYGCDDLNEDDDDDDDDDLDHGRGEGNAARSGGPAPASSSPEDPEAGGGGGVTRSRSRPKQEDKDPFEVAFEHGNADPWNPRSMPTARKWLITALASSGSFCVTCASSIYTSTYSQMTAELGCSRLVATLGLSTFVLGIALGPMWSPLSEFYGRRPIYLAAFFAFTVWIVPCAVADSIAPIIVARFFQGLSGSAFLSVSGGTVSDLFTPDRMHHPLTLFTAAPFLGPSIGPLIGGFINSNVNWRWTHYVMIIWAFCMFLAICFFVPETYRK